MSDTPDTTAALQAAVNLALAYDDLPEPWSSRLHGLCDAFWRAYGDLPGTTAPGAPSWVVVPPAPALPPLPEPGSYWWETCN